MRVSSVMTNDPVFVARGTSLDDALRIMDDNGVRHLPVLEGEELVGMLSDRDLLEATGWLPSRVHACRGPRGADQLAARVGEIASAPVLKVGPGEDVVAASTDLLNHGIGCLPVVEEGRLVGVLSEIDLLEAYAAACFESVSEGGVDPPVTERMTKDPETVGWRTTLGDARALCRSRSLRHLPVLQADQLVGIVSDRDLRRALGSGHPVDAPIDEFVTREPVTVGPRCTLSQAAGVMSVRKFSSLPIVDEGVLIGILTPTDVLEHWLAVSRRPV